jgi:pseudomonalisin
MPGSRITSSLLAVALATATTAGLALTGTEAPADAGTWSLTHTRAFDAARLGASLLATPTPSTKRLHLAIGLAPRHQAAERRAMRAIYTPGNPSYHHFLSSAQWRARYAPSASRVSTVRTYLAEQGLRDLQVSGNRMVVTATATAAQAQRAFHTSLAQFRLDGQTFTANTTAARVPSTLGGVVTAVVGLTTFHLQTPHPLRHTQASGSPDPFVLLPPWKFRRTYGAGHTAAGGRTAIAVFAQGSMRHVVDDLRTAERHYHLPQVPVTRVRVGPQSRDAAGLDEWDMDTQTSTAMAPHATRLFLYTVGALTDADIVPAFAAFVSQNRARAMSASIGGCDLGPYLDGSMLLTDQILVQGAMQGQTLFASSGDNGSGCPYGASVGVPTEPPGTSWPASSAFATAVGGTSLVVDKAGHRAQDPVAGTPMEYGWVGSGGGISEVENAGWWTAQTDPAYEAGLVTGGRAVPDISLDADPNVATAAAVWVKGELTGIGGTSLSAPLMLGAWARLESGHANRLGLASIGLYRLYTRTNPGAGAGVPSPDPAPVPGLTDIVVGSNGHYLAAPGYDEVTGLGAPDLAVLDRRLH